MSSLQLKALTKTIGPNHILCGIDLVINDGEFVVIVGPSGCGKSSLLRIISGLDLPSEGDLIIDGFSALDTSPAKRGVAMVFQSYALYPHLNVFENMAFALRIAKQGEAEINICVEKAARLLGIEDLLLRKPKALSGGQRQRVAIGRAIVRQPKLFLLDEPLSNLDAGLRVHMRHEFARLHRELKTTTVYVTHDQVEAMTLADKIVVLNEGRLEQIGTPNEIYHHPNNLFVASFLGSPRINLIKAEIVTIKPSSLVLKLVNDQMVSVLIDEEAVQPKAAIGDRVTLGVRSEALRRDTGVNCLPICVDIVETLGSALSIYGIIEGQDEPISAMLSANDRVSLSDKLDLYFDSHDGYVFDEHGHAFSRPVKADAIKQLH